ncbi:hypothetical protein PENTCL1PPCAC_28643, partial [Pristionchus entomophagus]
ALLLTALLGSVVVAAVPHAGAKFSMGSSANNRECPANVQRLLSVMCRDNLSPDFCQGHVNALTKLVEKYSTFDADTILGGECCSEKRCRLSVLRSLCCIERLSIAPEEY